MKTLLQELDNILVDKNGRIAILEWENEKLKKEIAELKNDIEKYKENEARMYE